MPGCSDFGEVADALEESVGHTGRSATSRRYCVGAAVIDIDAKNPGRAPNDLAEL